MCPGCGTPLANGNGSDIQDSDLLGALTLGTRLAGGSYSVGKLLGRGGFGITYLGADNRLGRAIALKEYFPAGATRRGATVVRPATLGAADYDAAMERFLLEAQILARFRHPGIVAVHDMFRENATAYMVMEYLKGETLAQKLERCSTPLPEAELIAIVEPLVDALDRMHEAGVLHRDIKPDNIVLAEAHGTTRPALIDFGAARDFVGGLTVRHSVVLTPGYAPLEQYGEAHRRGPFTDIYALAATLYHLATGVQPTAATDRAAGAALARPRALNPALTVAFDRAIMRGMEMKAEWRPQSGQEFFRALAGGRVTGSAGRVTTTRSQSTAPGVAPTVSAHLQRIQQIARELGPIDGRPTDKLSCPVCRAATMIDPSRATGKVRCPVCRAAGLEQRLSADALDRCPACRSGTLESAIKEALLRCPACATGYVTVYVKRRSLFLTREHGATCDQCAADFAYNPQRDSLTLVDLPGGPGALSTDLLGRTKPRSAWMRLSGRTPTIHICRACEAEFDVAETGSMEWVALARERDQVPLEHRGRPRTRIQWAKVASGLRPDDGTHACPSCRAQLDETQPQHLTLLRATHDPYGVVPKYSGRSYPLAFWRALAVGKHDPARPGLVCPACKAELEQSGDGKLALADYDARHDPYRIGSRYHKRRLDRNDWGRLAAGRPLQHEQQQLHEEAQQELWLAILAGEYALPEAEQSFPTTRAGNERVLLAFSATQVRPKQDMFYDYNSGQVWITTKKLLYHGRQSNLSLPLSKISDCNVQQVAGFSAGLAAIRRWDRANTIYFNPGPKIFHVTVDGLPLKLRWDASRFVALVDQLRRAL